MKSMSASLKSVAFRRWFFLSMLVVGSYMLNGVTRPSKAARGSP
jgi:hypothetical protein